MMSMINATTETADEAGDTAHDVAAEEEAIRRLADLADDVGAERLLVALYAHLSGTSAKTRAEFDLDPSPLQMEFLGAFLYPGIGRSDNPVVTADHVARGLSALDDI